MKLEYSEDAAIDIEEILNWIDIRQGFEAKNQWFDKLWEHANRLLNGFLAEESYSHEIMDSKDEDITKIFFFTPRGWNYQFLYTVHGGKIIVVRIREVPSSG